MRGKNECNTSFLVKRLVRSAFLFFFLQIMELEGDEFPMDELFFILLFVAVTWVQLYLYCYIGEMIIIEVEKTKINSIFLMRYN